jgi:hypothetical protein
MKTLRFFVEIGGAFQEALVNSCYFCFREFAWLSQCRIIEAKPVCLEAQHSAGREDFAEFCSEARFS